MILKRRRNRELELNLSSFSDIAFLLIIFFILTTTLVSNLGTRMSIPAGEASEQKDEKTPTILLTNTEIRYREKQLTLPELRQALLADDFPKQPADKRIVILESREDVRYQLYFSVLVAVDEAGAQLALMTDLKD